MSKIDKLKTKFWAKPVPNNITHDEAIKLGEHYGCICISGGKHLKIVHKESGTVITIPKHGKNVAEYCIVELKKLFEEIDIERE